jgi:hypothetical protein
VRVARVWSSRDDRRVPIGTGGGFWHERRFVPIFERIGSRPRVSGAPQSRAEGPKQRRSRAIGLRLIRTFTQEIAGSSPAGGTHSLTHRAKRAITAAAEAA